MRLAGIFVAASAALALPGFLATPHSPLAQELLSSEKHFVDNIRPDSRVIRQNDSLCDAGSAQWTGTVPLGDDRSMFFWYFESRENPESSPLIIWFNGGPGASSMLGALVEIGPCSVSADGARTTRNTNSWANFANILFIDQPIGVGFSRTEDPSLWASNLAEAGVDFEKFLSQFQYLFPSVRKNSKHLAGESFGGKYVPVFASMMRHYFDSVILVDPFIDFSNSILGLYDHFCPPEPSTFSSFPRYFNSTTCEEMEEPMLRCWKAGQACRSTYDTFHCSGAMAECVKVLEFLDREVVPGGRHPYDDRLTCDKPPLCGGLGMERVATYLNLPKVQEALRFQNFPYLTLNKDLNAKWSEQSDVAVPSSREIAALLDSKRTSVLFVNGQNDVVTNTEGLLRSLDDLEWSHQAGFRSQRFRPYYYRNSHRETVKGGEYKAKGNMTLVTVLDSGHMSPRDQPETVAHVVKKWLLRHDL